MTSDAIHLSPGDLLKIERRYVVDGVVEARTDEGRFAGVQTVGTSEHLALEDPKAKSVRLFPLHAISEITLVKAPRRRRKTHADATAGAAGGGSAVPSWDPGVA